MLLPKPGYNLSKNRDNFYLVVTCYRGGLKPPPGNNFEQQTLLVTGNNLVTRGNNLAKTGQIAKWEEAGVNLSPLSSTSNHAPNDHRKAQDASKYRQAIKMPPRMRGRSLCPYMRVDRWLNFLVNRAAPKM